jgi:hypothetical protein
MGDVMVTVVCPNPVCSATFPLNGMLDLGALPDSGFPYGTTDAVLGVDCPSCRIHLDVRWTTSWRPPT